MLGFQSNSAWFQWLSVYKNNNWQTFRIPFTWKRKCVSSSHMQSLTANFSDLFQTLWTTLLPPLPIVPYRPTSPHGQLTCVFFRLVLSVSLPIMCSIFIYLLYLLTLLCLLEVLYAPVNWKHAPRRSPEHSGRVTGVWPGKNVIVIKHFPEGTGLVRG